MTIENFNMLDEHKKVELIFDAVKITEKIDEDSNYQLFKIDNFYVETKTSLEGKFKRRFKTYTLKELPLDYAGEVLALPIVKLESEILFQAPEKVTVKRKKSFF